VKAKGFLESQKQKSNVAAEKEKEEKKEKKGEGAEGKEEQVEEEEEEEQVLGQFPPKFQVMSCKPVLFDLAHSACTFPDLSAKKKRGFFSFWRS